MFDVYAFADHRVVLSHPDVGTMVLSDGGIGRTTVAYSGENARATKAADGSTIINKIKDNSGTITIDVLQTSVANTWLTKYTNYVKNAPTSRFALGVMVITGLNGENRTCTGIAPQKVADITFDTEAQGRSWTFVAAEIDTK